MKRLLAVFSVMSFALLLLSCSPDGRDTNEDDQATDSTRKDRQGLPIVQERPIRQRSVDFPESGVDLGWGWNTQEEQAVPTVCVQFSLTREEGQTKHMTMKEVSDSYEVMNSMGMSASASVSIMGVNASGKAAFAKNTKVTGFNSNFVLTASVDNGVRYAAPHPGESDSRTSRFNEAGQKIAPDAGAIQLTPEGLRLAKRNDDLRRFQDTCGDTFVSAIYGGARLTSVITIEAKSHQEQEKISGELEGSGWGVHVKSNFSDVTETGGKSRNVTMRFFQTGGKRDFIPTEQSDLVKKLQKLAELADDAPKNFRITLTPYTALSNWPEKELEVNLTEWDQLASYWGAYTTLYDEIEFALQHACLFESYDASEGADGKFVDLTTKPKGEQPYISALRELQDELHAAIDELNVRAATCSEPDATCDFPAEEFLDPYGYRVRMPLPTPNVELDEKAGFCKTEIVDRGDPNNSPDLLIDYHVRDPAKRRCAISPANEGCLKNAEIDAWRQRLGRSVMRLPVEVVEVLVTERPRIEEIWYDPIEGTPFVWYDPAGKTRLEEFAASVRKDDSEPSPKVDAFMN